MLWEWTYGGGGARHVSLFINNVITFNFEMLSSQKETGWDSHKHTEMYILWSTMLSMETYVPPPNPAHISCPSLHHTLDPTGTPSSAHFYVVVFCTGYSFCLYDFSSLHLMKPDFFSRKWIKVHPSSLWAFLTSLFTLLSTFLRTNFYCSTYHYVVKISVCFCTGLWTREEVC